MTSINFSAKKKTRGYAKNNKESLNLSEVRMWMILKGSSYGFRRQQTIGNFIVDFASISHKIAIEMDGITHEDKREYDQQRENFILGHGYKLLRCVGMMPYPNDDIYNYIWDKIRELEGGDKNNLVIDLS